MHDVHARGRSVGVSRMESNNRKKNARERERERRGGGWDERLDVVYGVKAEDDLA